MTSHYINIRLLRDPESTPEQLLGVLFGKLHSALVELETGEVGISLPKHSAESTGDLLRLHGSREALETLQAQNWLQGLRDYVLCLPIAPVPEDCAFCVVSRVQTDSNPDRQRRRLTRRLMEREQLDESSALALATQRIPDRAAQFCDLPWIEMRSGSSGQRFRLFIKHHRPINTPTPGTFSTYGLSATATVPWF